MVYNYIYSFDGNDKECIKKAEIIYDNLLIEKRNVKMIYEEKQIIDKEFLVSNKLITKEIEEYLNINCIKNIFNPKKVDELWEKYPSIKGLYPTKKPEDNKPWLPISTHIYKMFKYGNIVEIL